MVDMTDGCNIADICRVGYVHDCEVVVNEREKKMRNNSEKIRASRVVMTQSRDRRSAVMPSRGHVVIYRARLSAVGKRQASGRYASGGSLLARPLEGGGTGKVAVSSRILNIECNDEADAMVGE